MKFYIKFIILVVLDASFFQSWFKYMMVTFIFASVIW